MNRKEKKTADRQCRPAGRHCLSNPRRWAKIRQHKWARSHCHSQFAGSPGAVWAVLTNEKAYPVWNPSIQRMKGELKTGGRIEVDIGPPGNTMTFRPVLLDVTPDQTLRWRGSIGRGGLFDVVHSFTLAPSNGGTEFVQSEQFSGLFVGWFTKGIVSATEASFRAMNVALKRRVEHDANNVQNGRGD